MAGHAGDVIATDEQVEISRKAVLTQLGGSGIAKNFDSLAHALDELEMWGFVENQARDIAQLHAFAVRDSAIINEATANGAFVDAGEE